MTIDATSLNRLRDELSAPLPHPDAEASRLAALQAIDWLVDDFHTLSTRPLGRTALRAETEALLGGPPPEAGRPFDEVLKQFRDAVAANSIRVTHPRFLAYIPSAPTWPSVLGDLLTSGTNFFGGNWQQASGPSQVELTVLRWFAEWLGLPAEMGGVLTSGGSEANLTALVVAREQLPEDERDRAILYVADQCHDSIGRAALFMGLKRKQIRVMPSDAAFRLDPEALATTVRRDHEADLRPWAVVANAGATRTGAVDPLRSVAALCRREGLWLHVDAAYGWAATLTPEGKAELDGIGEADSVTLDPHKWFGQTYESGCVLVRDGRLLARTFTLHADYLRDVKTESDEVNFMDRGLSLTRRARGLKLWLSVQVLGLEWFRSLVRHTCRLADYAEALLRRSDRFELLSPRGLSVVCFRYAPTHCKPGNEEALDSLNLCMVDALRATGRAILSSTTLRGRVALRLCFINWRTTSADVEEMLRLLAEVGDQLGVRLLASPDRPAPHA